MHGSEKKRERLKRVYIRTKKVNEQFGRIYGLLESITRLAVHAVVWKEDERGCEWK